MNFLLALALVSCKSPTPQPDASTAIEPHASTKPANLDLDALQGRLRDVAQKTIDRYVTVGVAVRVLHNGEVLLAHDIGLADIEAAREIANDSVFRIGSLTKSFTAAMILQLQRKGKLSLDDRASRYLAQLDGKYHSITIRQLLQHTSGIANYTSVPAIADDLAVPFSREEMVARLNNLPLDFEPGTDFSYSNSGYYLLGLILEKVSEMPYDQALAQMIAQPLELASVQMCPQEMNRASDAVGYDILSGTPKPPPPVDMTHPYAAGGICATAVDIATWLHLLTTNQVLGAADTKLMTTPLSPERDQHYGMGLSIETVAGHRKVGHGGAIPGYLSSMVALPEDGFVIVALANAMSPVSADLTSELSQAIVAAIDAPE